jgi:hypothetical protein
MGGVKQEIAKLESEEIGPSANFGFVLYRDFRHFSPDELAMMATKPLLLVNHESHLLFVAM